MLLADDNERDNGSELAVEIERLRGLNKKLRRKYQEASQEITDLSREHS